MKKSLIVVIIIVLVVVIGLSIWFLVLKPKQDEKLLIAELGSDLVGKMTAQEKKDCVLVFKSTNNKTLKKKLENDSMFKARIDKISKKYNIFT